MSEVVSLAIPMKGKKNSPQVTTHWIGLPHHKTQTPETESVIFETTKHEIEQPIIAAHSTSTYPVFTKKCGTYRDGEPNADAYAAIIWETAALLGIADGCNWGPGPSAAAKRAMTGYIEYLRNKGDQMFDLHSVGHLLLRAMCEANRVVESSDEEDFIAATTTALGGVVLKTQDEKAECPYAFMCANVGDCKALLWRRATGDVLDITSGNRLKDARDPGGRLGRYTDSGPDLRNLTLHYSPVSEGDLIILCTDGVYDNLDPVFLGREPKDLGLSYAKWSDVPQDVSAIAKEKFVTNLARELIAASVANQNEPSSSTNAQPSTSSTPVPPMTSTAPGVTPARVVNALLAHAIHTTEAMRHFMETNPGKKQPADSKLYPGKVDHTTCLAFQVGARKTAHQATPSSSTTNTDGRLSPKSALLPANGTGLPKHTIPADLGLSDSDDDSEGEKKHHHHKSKHH